jgi:acetoin utilization deacetylase AcuC-like enzyme
MSGNTRVLLSRIRSNLGRMKARWSSGSPAIWFDPAYRLPFSILTDRAGLEPRRADYVAWYLASIKLLKPEEFHSPAKVSYEDLCLVHERSYLESLGHPEALARIFAVDPSEVSVEELMGTIRLACGGTVEATRWALSNRRAALNLLGGFHHAEPDKGGGLCPINDIAVAVAVARSRGFSGRVAILDLDAHPPDGTAACFSRDFNPDGRVWIGSLSGVDWGALENVDETLLPLRCSDSHYLEMLSQLLRRMPTAELYFVVAGGDVLAGDAMAGLGLSLRGVRKRDLLVAERLQGKASVWLPGGGYHFDSWRVLAGTALAVSRHSSRPVSRRFDPMRVHFSEIAHSLDPGALSPDEFSEEDLFGALGVSSAGLNRYLDYYTREGIEFAFNQYGILTQLRRLGYRACRIDICAQDVGERLQVLGTTDANEELLIECVLEKAIQEKRQLLYVHWLTLRHPRARFSEGRPALPGQEVPGLGLAKEIGEMLALVAQRLKLAGVAYRPAWFHTAYAGRYDFRFVDPRVQGRFEALMRDFSEISLLDLTRSITDDRVLINGKPYRWEAEIMAVLFEPGEDFAELVEAEREAVHFSFRDDK